MSRIFRNAGSASLLDSLLGEDVAGYREAMRRLGRTLAAEVIDRLAPACSLMLICTNEDADFLASGMLEGMEASGFDRVALACFWTLRDRIGSGIEVAPVVRRYVEPVDRVDAFVVVKSIISSACTVQAVITELVGKLDPQRIVVASPVVLAGSLEALKSSFPAEVARRFDFAWLAEDDQQQPDGIVIPGIGGSVYERLGIGDSATKNRHVPEIVKLRRRRFVPN